MDNNELEYRLDNVSGPDHERQFTYSVVFNKQVLGSATGKKKKIAQNLAAKEALEKLV